MKYILAITMALLCSLFSHSQDSIDSTKVKDNPIVFVEFVFGYAGGSLSGTGLGGTINYQEKKNLYSFRYMDQTNLDAGTAAVSFIFLPFINIDKRLNEYSLLYGRRTIKDGHSFSYSAGISYNNIKLNKTRISGINNSDDSFFGFPFEVNIKWFKKEKKRFRVLYGAIPIGKPTSFGQSVGLKLYGNFGKLSYVGLGINYSLGWHRKY